MLKTLVIKKQPFALLALFILVVFLQTIVLLLGPAKKSVDAFAGNRAKAYALGYCISRALESSGNSGATSTSFYGLVQSNNLRLLRNNIDNNGFETGDVFSEADVNKRDVGIGVDGFDDTARCAELARDDSIGALFGMESLRDEAWELNSQGVPTSGEPIGYENGGTNYDLSSYQFFSNLQNYINDSRIEEKEAYDRLKEWFEECTVVGSSTDNDYTIEANEETLYFKRNRSTGFDVPIIGGDLVSHVRNNLNVEVDGSGYGEAECVGKTLVGVANAINLYDNATEERLNSVSTPTGVGAGGSGNVAGGDGEGGVTEETCEEASDSPLAWVMCPILGAIEDTINAIFNFVDDMLNIDAQRLYDDVPLRTAWSYFRLLATFLLLAVGLVMIISQAIGGNG